MTLNIENGTVVANANSYISTSYAVTYAAERGITFSDETTSYLETLAIKAKDYLEMQCFKGSKYSRDQVLQFPRDGVIIDGYLYYYYEIPEYLKYAQAEIMIAIDQGNDPNADRTTFKTEVKAAVVSVKYKEPYTHITSRRIDIYLSKLLEPQQLTIDRQ